MRDLLPVLFAFGAIGLIAAAVILSRPPRRADDD